MPMKNPPYPGGFVLRQCIEPLGVTITQLRRRRLALPAPRRPSWSTEEWDFSRNGGASV
jgi:hypothetical protein